MIVLNTRLLTDKIKIKKILAAFLDVESKFTYNEYNNHKFWDSINPHWSRETNFLGVWGINVRCGLIGGNLLDPYSYDRTLTDRRHPDFLVSKLQIMLHYPRRKICTYLKRYTIT